MRFLISLALAVFVTFSASGQKTPGIFFQSGTVSAPLIDTNSIILTGAGLSAANTTWRWDGVSTYSNSTAGLRLFFKVADNLWEITNNAGTLIYYANLPSSSADVTQFPYFWQDGGPNPPVPMGNFGITNTALSRLVHSGAAYATYFPGGLQTTYLNTGTNSFVSNDHPDFPSAVIAGSYNFERGYDSAIIGGNNNTNTGNGDVILGSAATFIRASAGEDAILGSEVVYMNNTAGVCSTISSFNVTNLANTWCSMIANAYSYMDDPSISSVMLGGQNNYALIKESVVGGTVSTNVGTRVFDFGHYNAVSKSLNDTNSSHAFGSLIRMTNAGNSGVIGFDITNNNTGTWVFGTKGGTVTASNALVSVVGTLTAPVVKTPLTKPQDASGTDIAGTNMVLAGGVSTGTGRGGSVSIQTSPSGSTGSTTNALVTRVFYSSKAVATANNLTTTICNIALGTSKWMGIRLLVTVYADNGTDFQATTQSSYISAVNKAGTVTTALGTIAGSATSASSGTLTATYSVAANGASVDIKASPVSSLTPTTCNVTYELEINSNYPVVITEQ